MIMMWFLMLTVHKTKIHLPYRLCSLVSVTAIPHWMLIQASCFIDISFPSFLNTSLGEDSMCQQNQLPEPPWLNTRPLASVSSLQIYEASWETKFGSLVPMVWPLLYLESQNWWKILRPAQNPKTPVTGN